MGIAVLAFTTGRTVNLPEKSGYRCTLIELSDEISGDIQIVEMGEKIQDETLAQKVARRSSIHCDAAEPADLKEAEFKNLKVRPSWDKLTVSRELYNQQSARR